MWRKLCLGCLIIMVGLLVSPISYASPPPQTDDFRPLVKVWERDGFSVVFFPYGIVLFPQGDVMAWRGDGSQFAIVSGRDVVIFDGATHEIQRTLSIEADGLLGHIDWHPTADEFLVADANYGYWLDGNTGAVVAQYPVRFNSIRWSPDGTQFAYSDREHVYVVDKATQEVVTSILDRSSEANIWHPLGQFIALRTFDSGGFMLYDVASGTLSDTYSGWDIIFNPNPQPTTNEPFAIINRWDTLMARQATTHLTLWALEYASYRMAWHPTQPWFALAVNQEDTHFIEIRDVYTGDLLQSIPTNQHTIKTLAWSADGHYLGSVDIGGTVKLWAHD